jgi:hypothetical protein
VISIRVLADAGKWLDTNETFGWCSRLTRAATGARSWCRSPSGSRCIDSRKSPHTADTMIKVGDIVEIVDMLLRISAAAVVPSVVISRAGTDGWRA